MTNRHRAVIPLASLWLAAGACSAASTFSVRAVRQDTGNPVEGATVCLDALPVGGGCDYEGSTDPFGYAAFAPAAQGYQVTIQHPGYAAVTQTLTLAAADRVFTNVVLTAAVPPGGGAPHPGYDLYVEVRCVMSGLPLATVPVRVDIFATSNAVSEVDSRVALTDANGYVILRGVSEGFHAYRFNDATNGTPKPKWKSLTSPSRRFVDRNHSVRAGLEPEKQAVSIEVRGLDVAYGDRFYATNQPLRRVYVELTGGTLDGNGNFIALLPPRTGITDDGGAVSFSGLPALTWCATTKRLGYNPDNAVLVPDGGGNLPAVTTLRPTLRSNKFWVALEHPYADPRVLQGLKIRVQGLLDTNTEGVHFLNAYVFYDGAFHWQWHTLYNLIPGRYRVSVDGDGTGIGSPAPGFTAEAFVELDDKLSPNPNLTWTDITLPLEAKSTEVRGRLWSAETMPDAAVLADFSASVPPIYNLYTGGVAIVFREYETTNGTGPWLKADLRTVTTTVNSNGEFSVRLPSTRWGVEIPSLTNHFGSHARLRNLTTTISSEQDVKQGWPYYRWPHASAPPGNGQPKFGYPLTIRHAHEYDLDLFVRRKILAVSGVVEDSVDEPTPGDLYYGAAARRAQVTLTPTAGAPVTVALESNGGPGAGRFFFGNVMPGDYTLSIAHPRNSFLYAGAAAPLAITVPSFPAPGVVPVTDPEGFYPAPFGNLHQNGNIEAQYTPSTSQITFHRHRWDGGAYVNNGDTTYFEKMQADYLPNVRFGNLGVPVGGFTCWHPVIGHGYKEGRVNAEGATVDVDVYYDGGPLDNVGPLPPLPATVEVRVVNADDPASFVQGTRVTLDGAVHVPAFTPTALPHTLTGYEGFGLMSGAVNSNWVYRSVSYETVDVTEPRRRTTIRMGRATRFEGAVTSSAGGAPIEGARVAVKDRFGNALTDGETDAAGEFGFPSHVNESGPVYVELDAPGFVPKRLRYGPETPGIVPDPGDPDDKAVMTIAESLVPVPPPIVTDDMMSRRGQFLPGIVKVGNSVAATEGLATNELTLDWEVTFDTATYTFDLPPFDAPDGTPPTPGPEAAADELLDVYLVDPRFYGVTGTVTTAIFGNPYSEIPNALDFPQITLFNAVRKFIKDLGGPAAPSVFRRRAEEIEQTGPNTWRARGTVPLWQLPPGEFTPRIVALTRRGAVAYHDLDGYELEGVRVPRALGFAADVMAAVSRNAPLVDHVATYIPKGRFVARPGFITEINEGASAPGYLDYLFRLELTANESMDNPGTGELGFMPGGLGLNMVAQADITFDGKARKIGLTVRGDLTATEDIDISEYAPPFLKPYDPELTIKEPTGGLETTLSKTFPGGGPNALELIHRTSGGIGIAAALNLTPALSRIPQVGPVLLALDKTGALTIGGDLDARIDLVSTRAWATRFPVPGETLPIDRELRTHFLGGDEQTTTLVDTNSVDLAFNFGMGLSVALAGERAGARGGLRLAGEEHPRTGRPSLVLTMNPDGDWPMFTRLRGQVSAELSAFLDVWVTRLEKDYTWELAAFDVPLSTEGNLLVTPIETAYRTSSPDTASSATFTGGYPDPVSGLYPVAPVELQADGAGMLVYADPNGAAMALRVSARLPDGSWTAPVTVPAGGAIAGLALIERPSGGYLMVWSEIAPGNYANPLPDSTLRFVTSSDGVSWGAPATLGAIEGVAHHLRLVRSGPLTALMFLNSTDEPTNIRVDFDAAIWNDGPATFGAPLTLASDLELRSFAVAGDPAAAAAQALIVMVKLDRQLVSRTWDGVALSAETPLGDDALDSIALAPDGSNAFRLAWLAPDALRQERHTAGTGWTNLPGLVNGAVAADDLALARIPGSTQTLHVAVWTSAGNASALWYRFSDAAGNPLGEPVNLSMNSVGDYSDPVLLPLSNGVARVLARFAASPVKLREFQISLEPATGDKDSDADGLLDTDELRMIDADPDDAVAGLADVLPGGDFDGDGMSNGDEVRSGTDPADPNSVLAIRDIVVIDDDSVTIFDSVYGINYLLQANTNLLNTNGWQTVAPFTGTGRREGIPGDGSAEGRNFYRIAVPVP